MAFQRVPETVLISTLYTQNSVDMQMTFYARRLGGYSEAQMASLAGGVDGEVGSEFLPTQTQDTNYNETEVRGLDSENDLVVSSNLNAGPGTEAVGGLPNNVTIAIKRTSILTGRSARGRVYWIGLATSFLTADENFITLGANANIVDAVDSIKTICTTFGWLPVIVSRFSGGVQRAEGVTFEWENTSNEDLRVDSQRGRLP